MKGKKICIILLCISLIFVVNSGPLFAEENDQKGLDETRIEATEFEMQDSIQKSVSSVSVGVVNDNSGKEIVAFGTWDEDISWTLFSNGLFVLSGYGNMFSAFGSQIYDVPWHEYRDQIINVEISEGIYSIGAYSFYGCGNLVHISIPDSVTYISEFAFYGCSNLENIELSDSLSGIGEYAFGCTGITNIIIPDNVSGIYDGAFQSSELKSITLPNRMSEIGDSAFRYCMNLEKIVIPEGIETLDYELFEGCYSLRSIYIPKSVKTIEKRAIHYSCGVKDIFYSGTENEWKSIQIKDENSLNTVTIHFNCEIGDSPVFSPPLYSGIYMFDKWDETNQFVYLNDWAYDIADNADMTFVQKKAELVGHKVYAEIQDNKVLRICPLEEHIGALRDYSVCEKDGVSYASQITISGERYSTISENVYNWSNFDRFPVGTKVAYYLVDDKIALMEMLQYRAGRLDTRLITGNTITIDGDPLQLSDSFVAPYTSDLTDWEGKKIGYYVGESKDENSGLSIVYEITGPVNEEASIKLYSSSPNLEVQVGETMELVAALIIDDGIDCAWSRPAFVVGNESVITLSEISTIPLGRSIDVTGVSEGTSSLTITDSESGAHLTVNINVVPALTEAKNYSYKIDSVPAFYPDVICDRDQLTNFYNFNDMYVSDYKTEKVSTGTRVTFDVYNHNYMIGAVDVYDADGNWIQSKAIKKYSDISSLYDTGEALVYLIWDGIHENLLSYTAKSYSEKTSVDIVVPTGGHFSISNNFSVSPGAYFYNCIDYLTFCIETVCDVAVSAEKAKKADSEYPASLLSELMEMYRKEGEKPGSGFKNSLSSGDVTNLIVGKMNSINTKAIGKANTLNAGDAMGVVLDDFKDLLDLIGLDWKGLFKTTVGVGESAFEKLSGPAGVVLKGLFTTNKMLSRAMQTYSLANSLNRSYITIHSKLNTANASTVSGVKVSYDKGTIDEDTVLQVFRIGAPADTWVINGADVYPEQYELYNISFVKNEKNVQPNGKVIVRIPVPVDMTADKCIVYRQENDNSWTRLEAHVEGDYLVFETDHFSMYLIREEQNNSLGDVNGDGDVNAKDLTTLAKHVAKITTITDADLLAAADVNKDGDVNAKDLTHLAKYVAKIITEL